MLKIIVAHDPNRVIGNGIHIPWHISEDFKHFKQYLKENGVKF